MHNIWGICGALNTGGAGAGIELIFQFVFLLLLVTAAIDINIKCILFLCRFIVWIHNI